MSKTGRNTSNQSSEAAQYIRKTSNHRLKECRSHNSAPCIHLLIKHLQKGYHLPRKFFLFLNCFIHQKILTMQSQISYTSNQLVPLQIYEKTNKQTNEQNCFISFKWHFIYLKSGSKSSVFSLTFFYFSCCFS